MRFQDILRSLGEIFCFGKSISIKPRPRLSNGNARKESEELYVPDALYQRVKIRRAEW